MRDNLSKGVRPPVVVYQPTGDPCHYDIVGISKKVAGSLLKKAWKDNPDSFFQCDGINSEPLNRTELASEYKA